MKRISRPIVCHVRVTLCVLDEHVVVTIGTVPRLVPRSVPCPVPMIPRVDMPPPLPLPRSKALTKKNEEQDIELLVHRLNHPSGADLRGLYHTTFPGKTLLCARLFDPHTKKKAGSRSVHYDFQILVQEGSKEPQWLKVEHKGSSVYKPLDDEMPPWTGGVQFFNGGMEKYRLCRRYAEAWYSRYMESGFLSREYGLDEPIPSCEEWIQRDARVQGDPKTAFGKALKRAVRAKGQESLLTLRDTFVPDFMASLTEADSEAFLEDVSPILQDSFSQKDVWLQVAGDIASGSFHARWSPALSLQRVTGIRWGPTKKDITGWIESDCVYPIRFILRWGKGAGFSNLRLDLK